MILTALNDYYERLLNYPDTPVPPLGYSYEKISFALVLSTNGTLVDIMDLRDTSGKSPRPGRLSVPQSPKRAGIKPPPAFLWDNTKYTLGKTRSSDTKDLKRAEEAHETFKSFHEEILSETQNEGLQALLRFLRSWDPADFEETEFLSEDMLDSNLVFRLDGEREYLHEGNEARELRRQLLEQAASEEGACLATGSKEPISRLHPGIKGVRDAQSSGASIVSFNLSAFGSYGKSQGDNAPVSEKAAFGYTTALNHLLRGSEDNHQRLQIGDATTVFWAISDSEEAAEAAETTLAQLLDPKPDDTSETDRLRTALEEVTRGRPLSELDGAMNQNTQIYILGLAPNASRLSIRYWETGSLATFAKRLSQHYQDLQIDPLPWKSAPGIWRLLLQTVPHPANGKPKTEDVPPQIAGELTRSILTGQRYPRSLLTNIIMRMRSDGDISGLRVALCKAVMARDLRVRGSDNQKEVPVSLDKENTDPGYRLGRLFAVLENAQRSALGENVNATIRDRYYGAASATPASIFPVLLRNSQHHLGRLRKDKPGAAVNLEKEIGEIMDGLETTFPKSLKIESQGRFAIGYYHQNQSRFQKTDDNE